MSKRKLNLGCGTDIREGYINLDVVNLPGVDVYHDLNVFPYPFPDNYFDLILARHVLEHTSDIIGVMRELHRILKPKGSLHLYVPHFTSKDAFSDPTHKHCFSINSFEYFTKGHHRNYYFDFAFSRIISKKLKFQKTPFYPWNYFLEFLVNINRRLQNLYEGSPLRCFPAYEIEIRLEK